MVIFFSIVPISIGVTEILKRLSTGLRSVGAARSIYYPGACPATRNQPSEDLLDQQAFSLFQFSDLTGQVKGHSQHPMEIRLAVSTRTSI